jgi:hypothetical protein
MNIISLGSNCEVSEMIMKHLLNMLPNSKFYNHLFAWTSVPIKGINHFFKNPSFLDFNNFRYVYRIFNEQDGNINKKADYCDFNELVEDIRLSEDTHSIHIDVSYSFEDIYTWTHGIVMSISDFNDNNNNIEKYLNDLKNKTTHIIKKTLDIMENDNVKLFCIKCLKGEYSIQDIIELNTLVLNCSSNNYLLFIVEKDENIILDNLNLTNTCIVEAPKLTGHHEAVYSDRYNTDIYYIELFKNAKQMLNM